MIPDSEGFLAPEIDQSRCIGCKLCETVCPVLSQMIFPEDCHPDVFAAWHKNAEVRNESSSGGAFSALAEIILNRGGVVFGAAYDENMQVHHIFIETKKELDLLRQSKYVQSDSKNCFRKVRIFLSQGRNVLFVGTPCQIAGLVHFLGRDRNENLITCDFVCHGVPSPLFFEAYLQWLHSRRGLKPDGFRFRDKKSGWYDALRVCSSRGRDYYMREVYDCYFYAFNRNFILRNSCYHCPTNGENRIADLTLGDFWGIGRREEFPKAAKIANGISLVCVHSDAGRRLLKASEQYLNILPRSWEEALAGNRALIHSPKCPKERSEIYHVLRENGFEVVLRRFLHKNLKEKIVSLIREYLPRRLVLFFRNRIS